MSKSRIGDTTTEMEEQDLPIEGIADGSSSSMDESLSTLFASVLAPLHELHIHDEEEEESDEEDLNDLRWGESSVSDFSGKEKSSLFPPVVRRNNHPSKQYQQLLANYHDSFNSTTTTISTSSIESNDRPPKIPKRRIITFSDEVEIREFEVKEESTSTTSTDEEEEALLPNTIHDTQREKEDF